MIFGFMITTWYSAILGSLITTNLYDPQIRTLDDMRKANMKYVYQMPKSEIEMLSFYNETSDLSIYLNSAERKKYLKSLQSFTAGVISYTVMMDFPKIYEHYVLSDFVLEYYYLKAEFNTYSRIYTLKFNEYLGLIHASGLYLYWKRNYDLYDESFFSFFFVPRNLKKLRVLDLNFFVYPFAWILGGLLVASYVFFAEISYDCFVTRKQRKSKVLFKKRYRK